MRNLKKYAVMKAAIVVVFLIALVASASSANQKAEPEAEVDTPKEEHQKVYAGAIAETTDALGREIDLEVASDDAKISDVPTLKAPASVSDVRVCTKISLMVGESTIFEFSDTGKHMWIAFYADADGMIKTAEICNYMGYPSLINYGIGDFLASGGEIVGKMELGDKTLRLTADQYNLLVRMFGENIDYLQETELGRFGYYEDGMVAVTSYLEDNGLKPDEDGIYWASPEGALPREGVKLEVAETQIHDENNEEVSVEYLQPTFYAVVQEYDKSEDDYVEVVKEWRPETEKCVHSFSGRNFDAEVAGEFVTTNYNVLDGIMQLVQRGDTRNEYCYLDPGTEPINNDSTLFYQEVYEPEE